MEKASSSVETIGERKQLSIAWQHFQVIPGTINGEAVDFAKCKYCPTKYQYSGRGINDSTGNMMSHLKKKHSQFFNAEGPVQSQQEYVSQIRKLLSLHLVHDDNFYRFSHKNTIAVLY